MNILGFMLILHSSVGIYQICGGNSNTNWFFIYSGLVNFLALTGSAALMNFSLPIWESYGYQSGEGECVGYFGFFNTDNRCDDEGYIAYIRIIGLISVFTCFASTFLGMTKVASSNSVAAAKSAEATALN